MQAFQQGPRGIKVFSTSPIICPALDLKHGACTGKNIQRVHGRTQIPWIRLVKARILMIKSGDEIEMPDDITVRFLPDLCFRFIISGGHSVPVSAKIVTADSPGLVDRMVHTAKFPVRQRDKVRGADDIFRTGNRILRPELIQLYPK